MSAIAWNVVRGFTAFKYTSELNQIQGSPGFNVYLAILCIRRSLRDLRGALFGGASQAPVLQANFSALALHCAALAAVDSNHYGNGLVPMLRALN